MSLFADLKAYLRFHDNCGKNITLSNNNQTAQWTSLDEYDEWDGVVMSHDPMLPDMLYQVSETLSVSVSVSLSVSLSLSLSLSPTEREVDQGHQPGAESDSKTNRSHGQSQEADVEATPSPVEQERVSQPASTARTLRSGRDTQKGRSQSQSSNVDSFRRMQSSDRTKDNQARIGGTQDRSASASNR